MKEQFVKAEMEIVEFEVEDIITTSGNGNNDPELDLNETMILP